MRKTVKVLMIIAAFMATALTALAQNAYKLHKYTPNDGGILTNITPNGKWAIIKLGTTAGSGNAEPKLFNVETEEVIPIAYNSRSVNANAVSNDGNIVVGNMSGRAVAFNRSANKITLFKKHDLWQSADLTAITPDGKWAVGFHNGYNGKFEENNDLKYDYYYMPLFVNVETGDTISTPGLPKRDMAGLDQHAMKFVNITPDGRYIIGVMSWYILQPNSPVVFIYDTQTHTYKIVGFTENSGKDWTPLYDGLHHVSEPDISPDGHWLTGLAYITKPIPGSEFFKEYGAPFRYDIQKGTFEIIDNTEINIESCVIDNNGTIFGNPNTGSPLRDFRVLYKDKFWISLYQICKQQYGFNFNEKTGFDRTGSATSVSSDGSRIVSFVDPLGESYIFDFGQPIENVCDGIDLLDNYTVTPEDGSIFSVLNTIDINFGRNVQVLGKGNTHVHLYKEDGTKVADALSTASGLALKTGSSTTVTAVFRPRPLDKDAKYYVVIDAGAVAVANDASRKNKEIRINYTGRNNGPVEVTNIAPANHSSLRQVDASSSYILLTFDCPVKLTNEYSAYIERVDDGSRIATLSVSEGNSESTKNQILLCPSSTIYLYDGIEYKVVLGEGSVCDYADSESSFNKQIEVLYHGTYIREVSNDDIIFADAWDNVSESLQLWLRYEGDHNTPLASMEAFEFDADNQPWNFSMRSDSEDADYCAASHSLYAPSGTSDDWMMTPQLIMPSDGKATLQFDAQSLRSNKKDKLKLYVFEEDFVISYLNDSWMEDIRKRAELLDEIELNPGESEEGLKGDWQHFSYNLSKWANKNIYIAFVNQNYNQSMIFVDNVEVKRELLYTIGFTGSDRVVSKKEHEVAGQFTVKTGEDIKDISLTLKDSNGTTLGHVEWNSLTSSVKDKPLPFSFSKPLPLTIGEENKYTIDVTLGNHKDTFKGSVIDLAFQPTKRVVLEEMTGVNCPNCPLGIISIEKCEKAFPDQFIPISIHSYPGDPYAGSMGAYSDFLKLNGAPSARINRIEGIFKPLHSKNGKYLDSDPEEPLWYDVVTSELNKLPIADIELYAVLGKDNKTVEYEAPVKFALNATNQQLSLLIVVLENGILSYQTNAFGSISSDVLGEWGDGGSKSAYNAYPVIHNDLVRSVIGNNMSGTIGLYPSAVKANNTYTAKLSSTFPESISSVENAFAVAMLIDSQTGEVLNAAKAPIITFADAIDSVNDDNASATKAGVFTLTGVKVRSNASDLNTLPAGIYIVGGKKVMVK